MKGTSHEDPETTSMSAALLTLEHMILEHKLRSVSSGTVFFFFLQSTALR